MVLDVPTLATVTVAVSFALAVNMTVLCVLLKRPPALVKWAIALWALAAGQLVAQLLPPNGGPLLLLANVLVSLANAFLLLGIAAHFRRPINFTRPFLLVAAYAISLMLLLTTSRPRHVEEPLFAIHSLIWDAWIIWWLLVRSPKALKASSILTALVFIADLLFYLMKAVLEFGGYMGELPGFAAGLISSNYLFGTLSTMLLTIGLLAMLAEKMTNDLRHAAEHDALTGLPNRAVFTKRARRKIARCNESGLSYVLMLCDLDNFKAVNDRWGHGAGDRALKHFSTRIRKAGLPRAALFSRYGGEEFAVFLPGFERAQAAELAECLRHRIEQSPVDHGGEAISLTVSIGAVVARNTSYEQAVDAADVALYAAKGAGRNRVVWANDMQPA